MRNKEQRLWDRMKRNAPAHMVLERVENMLDAGFPDILAKHRWGKETYLIELKAVDDYPARATTRVFGDEGLSIAQRNWLMRWTQAQGQSLIICSVGAAAQLEHFAIPGKFHDIFNDMTRNELLGATLVKSEHFWDDIFDWMGDVR